MDKAVPLGERVVLVSMPWASATHPSLAAGLLAALARAAGFGCRTTYPCLDLAAILARGAYESLANSPGLYGLLEHVFAVDIFGHAALNSDSFINSAENLARPFFGMRDHIVPVFLSRTVERVLAQEPSLVGFSCTFAQVMPSLALARRLKAMRPELTTVLGGPCVHGPMGEAYARAFPEFIDHVFTGEADRSFVGLLQARRGGQAKAIAGITYGGRLLDAAPLVDEVEGNPWPDYEAFFAERATLKAAGEELPSVRALPYESARGCWWGEKHHCTFCGLNNLGMRYRRKSAEATLAELVGLSAKHRICSFMAADNILDHNAYRDLLPKLAELGLDLTLFYEIKSNVNRDDVALLARAGVTWVQPGIESFASNVLRLMKKGVSSLQNVQFLKWAAEYAIDVAYNVLVGFTGETDQDYLSTIDLIGRLNHLQPPKVDAIIAQAHRFSPFFDQPELFGVRGLRPSFYYEYLIPRSILLPEAFAYFFDRDLAENEPYHRHIDSLNEALRSWRKTRTQVVARLAPGFIEILTKGTVPLALDPLESAVFVLADRQTRPAKLRAQLTPSASAAKVDAAVERLIAKSFVVSDGDDLVSVIPFARPQTTRSLAAWLRNYTPGVVSTAAFGAPSLASQAAWRTSLPP